MPEAMPTFEPVMNYPALASFLLIATVFGLLQLRTNGISTAAARRVAALKALREVKSQQLSLSSISQSSSQSRPGAGDLSAYEANELVVRQAMKEYEAALDEEERLRTIIPGVRIIAPNNPNSSKSDIAAAKQFLNRDLGEGDSSTNNGQAEGQEGKGLSNALTVVIVLVGISQLALLYLLAYDPLSASEVVDALAGGGTQ
jgi:hypothetical protein